MSRTLTLYVLRLYLGYFLAMRAIEPVKQYASTPPSPRSGGDR